MSEKDGPSFRPSARLIPWEEVSRLGIDPPVQDPDQYATEGWRLEGVYVVEHPHRPGCLLPSRKVGIWRVSVEGMREYAGRRRAERESRREEYRRRVEEEDQFTAEINERLESIEDQKAPWRSRKGEE